MQVMDRLSMTLASRCPWWELSEFVEKNILKTKQKVLNKHGMEPAHRWAQQHLVWTFLKLKPGHVREYFHRGCGCELL